MFYFVRIMSVISALYLGVVILAYAFQRHLVYHPSGARSNPAALSLAKVAEITLETPDRERLVAWYAPARIGRPTLLYFHGNAGTLAQRADRIRLYTDAGYGVLLLAYRGFSGSTGAPSESRIIRDANLAYDYLLKQGLTANDIVLYGESLGTAVAVQVGASRQIKAVILESPFSSVTDIGQYIYPYLPVRWLLEERFESIRYIQKINAPLLVLHGERDSIVPARFGKALFTAARAPKSAHFVPDGNHYDLYEHGAWQRIQSFLHGLSAYASANNSGVPAPLRPLGSTIQ